MSKIYIKSVILMHVSYCDPLPNMVLAGRGDAVRGVEERVDVRQVTHGVPGPSMLLTPQNASKPTPTVKVCEFILPTFILPFFGEAK